VFNPGTKNKSSVEHDTRSGAITKEEANEILEPHFVNFPELKSIAQS